MKPDPAKPPYKVLSMDEIKSIPYNGFNAISTFSGCGGSSLGYKMAGFRVLWANEFIPAAQDTYRANHPDAILNTKDIHHVTPQEILDAISMKTGDLDLFDGSPPCASFSTAGKRESGWGKVKQYSDTKQRTDDLFFEYIRLLEGLQPKVFVAENVSGLIKGTAKGYFLEILSGLKACGYNVTAKLLDAQWLGVPQQRQRIIFVGVRNDLGLMPAFPKPLSYRYSVRDAIPWILTGIGNIVEVETDISRFAIGIEADNIAEGQQSKKYRSLVRSPIDGPSPTLTGGTYNQSIASVIHPTEKRRFSIAELKRICAFPDDFILTGSYSQQWERLGRAVPPVMMSYIAATIRDEILCKL
jgi:DNA (cytosine-5)-methyltransferase 1